MSPLPALVLTAGLGTRLDPLTRLRAKAAVPLGGRTLIEHVLDWLRRQGVADVVLNLHHLPATITASSATARISASACAIRGNSRCSARPAARAARLPLLDADEFLIVNGDTLCDFDVAPMLDGARAARRRRHDGGRPESRAGSLQRHRRSTTTAS